MNKRKKQFLIVVVSCTVLAFTLSFLFAIGSGSKTESIALAQTQHKIGYLISDSTKSLVASKLSVPSTGIYNDVNRLIEQDAKDRLDAIVFDAQTKGNLKLDWLQNRYPNGLVVVGIDVPIGDLANLVGDKTAIRGTWVNAKPLQNGSFYSMLYFVVVGNPADVALYKSKYANYLKPDGSTSAIPGINSKLSVVSGISETYIRDDVELKTMSTNINLNIETIKKAFQNSGK